MKVAILAGGSGTRLSEETVLRPKPMIEVGGRPILWHIMKIYAQFGFNEFVVGLGYKGDSIKEYFLKYYLQSSSITVTLKDGKVRVHNGDTDDWTVHLLETGPTTNTGGRVKRMSDFIGNETFLLTYGDGVADVNISKLVEFHRARGKLATVTAVHPPARFGSIAIENEIVSHFAEKPQLGDGWINGGFYVLEPEAARLVTDDSTMWEGHPMEQLAKTGQLAAYQHSSFWQCMDTLRDVHRLESLWQSGAPPWKIWN